MSYNVHQFRQSAFLDSSLTERPLYLIGAGGIGSPTALVLHKMGFTNMTVIDPDNVEDHNVGSQLYLPEHVDKKKVEGLTYFTPGIKVIDGKFPDALQQLEPLSIVVSGVDSMEERSKIWAFLKTQKLISLYIDARMSLEMIRVYAIVPREAEQVKLYEQNLYSDAEAEELPCSAKAVAYNGFFAASVIGGLVSAHLRGVKRPLELIGDMSEFMLAPTL